MQVDTSIHLMHHALRDEPITADVTVFRDPAPQFLTLRIRLGSHSITFFCTATSYAALVKAIDDATWRHDIEQAISDREANSHLFVRDPACDCDDEERFPPA